jgi:hypothetical protein
MTMALQIVPNRGWAIVTVEEIRERTLVFTSDRFVPIGANIEMSFRDHLLVGRALRCGPVGGGYRLTADVAHAVRVFTRRSDRDRAA